MDFGPDRFVMRMTDGSMEPRIREGEYVYVDPDVSAADGRFVGVRGWGSRPPTVRQYVESEGRRELRALAPGWPEWPVGRDNETLILGVVMLVGRPV